MSISVIERLQRQRERVERGDPEEPDLDRVVAGELDPFPARAGLRRGLAEPIPRDEHDHRPADTDQEPVRARHVRERQVARGLRAAAGERRARRVELVGVATLRREHEVHGVFGQDRDQREDRDREPRGDVELRRLGRPRDRERRPDDREAVEQREHGGCRVESGVAGEERGDREQRDGRQRSALAARVEVDQIVRHGHQERVTRIRKGLRPSVPSALRRPVPGAAPTRRRSGCAGRWPGATPRPPSRRRRSPAPSPSTASRRSDPRPCPCRQAGPRSARLRSGSRSP